MVQDSTYTNWPKEWTVYIYKFHNTSFTHSCAKWTGEGKLCQHFIGQAKIPAKKKGGVHQAGLPWAVLGMQMLDYLWAKEEMKKDAEEKEKHKGEREEKRRDNLKHGNINEGCNQRRRWKLSIRGGGGKNQHHLLTQTLSSTLMTHLNTVTLTMIDQKGLEKTCVMNVGQDVRSMRLSSRWVVISKDIIILKWAMP